MDQKTIDRINELARKSKTEGLTPEEKEEQKKLRAEYIAVIRMNMRAQLDNIDVLEKDGSVTNLGEKYGLKKEIRKYIFDCRKKMAQETADALSKTICETVIHLPEFKEASCVYAYVDYNKEVVTRGIIEEAWKAGKRVAVPKVTGAHEMKYYYLESFDQLEPGYFQIPEPAYGEEAHDEDAFLIVPGVAFDENRHRAGYGQGFYDRYLDAHRAHKTTAVAFEFQIVEEVPAEPTDIFPNKVVTEKRTIE